MKQCLIPSATYLGSLLDAEPIETPEAKSSTRNRQHESDLDRLGRAKTVNEVTMWLTPLEASSLCTVRGPPCLLSRSNQLRHGHRSISQRSCHELALQVTPERLFLRGSLSPFLDGYDHQAQPYRAPLVRMNLMLPLNAAPALRLEMRGKAENLVAMGLGTRTQENMFVPPLHIAS